MGNFLGNFKNLLNFRKGSILSYSQSFRVGDTQSVYIDTSNLEYIYKAVPHLREVIDYKASLLGSLRWGLTDLNGEVIDDKNGILNLLNNPNPLQGGSQFVKSYSISKSIYGNSFIYQNNKVLDKIPNTIWVLPAESLNIKPTGKMFDQTKVEGIISYYKDENTNKKYKPEEVIHIKDCSTNLLKGDSKIETLIQPISNIKEALESRNVLITNRGGLGILSAEAKDGIPLNSAEKERLEEQYTDTYGLNKGKKTINITSSSVKWQPMTFPTKDLMLFEEVEEDFSTIIDTYGLDRDLFSSTKGATFENKKEALVGTYHNTIIPEAEELAQELMNKWNTKEIGVSIVPLFDLQVLKEDESKTTATFKTKTETLLSLLDRELITPEDIKQKLEL